MSMMAMATEMFCACQQLGDLFLKIKPIMPVCARGNQ
jgi:hypothetical protein